MKKLMYAIVLTALLAMVSASNAALVSDDFEDGDYTSDPTWTNVSGTWTVETETGNKWVKGAGSGAALEISTGITGSEGYAEVTVTGRLRFYSATVSNNNYAGIFLRNDAGTSYLWFRFWLDSADNNCDIRARKNSGDTYSSSAASNTGMTAIDTWYSFKGVWKSTNEYELWVDSGNGLTKVTSGSDTTSVVELGDFENVRCYTKSGAYNFGFDDIVVTPEPATMTLLLLGLPFALCRRR